MRKRMSVKSSVMLILTAFIWGVAFVAQSVGMDYIGPFTFTCIRSLLGGVVLIPCIWFLDKMNGGGGGKDEKTPMSPSEKKVLFIRASCADWLCAQLPIWSKSGYSIQRWERQGLLRPSTLCWFQS